MEIVGLSEEKVKKISEIKHENDWVLDYRLKDISLLWNKRCLCLVQKLI